MMKSARMARQQGSVDRLRFLRRMMSLVGVISLASLGSNELPADLELLQLRRCGEEKLHASPKLVGSTDHRESSHDHRPFHQIRTEDDQ